VGELFRGEELAYMTTEPPARARYRSVTRDLQPQSYVTHSPSRAWSGVYEHQQSRTAVQPAAGIVTTGTRRATTLA